MARLRANLETNDIRHNLGVITGTAEGDSGIPNGDVLIAFSDAAIGEDKERLAEARDATPLAAHARNELERLWAEDFGLADQRAILVAAQLRAAISSADCEGAPRLDRDLVISSCLSLAGASSDLARGLLATH